MLQRRYGLADNEDNIPDIIKVGALQRLVDCGEKLSVQASKVSEHELVSHSCTCSLNTQTRCWCLVSGGTVSGTILVLQAIAASFAFCVHHSCVFLAPALLLSPVGLRAEDDQPHGAEAQQQRSGAVPCGVHAAVECGLGECSTSKANRTEGIGSGETLLVVLLLVKSYEVFLLATHKAAANLLCNHPNKAPACS